MMDNDWESPDESILDRPAENYKRLSPALVLLIIIAILLACGLIFGCNSPKRMLGKFNALAAKCEKRKKTDTIPVFWSLQKFPPQTKTTTKYKNIPGKTQIVPGKTVYVVYNCDSAIQSEKGKVKPGVAIKEIRIPVPEYLEVDTALIIQNITSEDNRRISLMNVEFSDLNDKYIKAMDLASKYKQDMEKAKENSRTRLYWCIGEGVFSLLLMAIIVMGISGKLSKII